MKSGAASSVSRLVAEKKIARTDTHARVRLEGVTAEFRQNNTGVGVAVEAGAARSPAETVHPEIIGANRRRTVLSAEKFGHRTEIFGVARKRNATPCLLTL